MKQNTNIQITRETYRPEELYPIVVKLAASYAGFENTSISYEAAKNLMEAVLYCIHEYDMKVESEQETNVSRLPAAEAYAKGYRLVIKKAQDLLARYNQLMPLFQDYGMRCLHDTVVKGIPEFLKWYDPKYAPQNTMLLFDYPILEDISMLSGVDAVYRYLECICLEQEELAKLDRQYVIGALKRYHSSYEDLFENIYRIVTED